MCLFTFTKALHDSFCLSNFLNSCSIQLFILQPLEALTSTSVLQADCGQHCVPVNAGSVGLSRVASSTLRAHMHLSEPSYVRICSSSLSSCTLALCHRSSLYLCLAYLFKLILVYLFVSPNEAINCLGARLVSIILSFLCLIQYK